MRERPQRPVEPGSCTTPPYNSMIPNRGFQPEQTKGRRVRVELANGREQDDWPADFCRWTLTDSPFDIAAFEVV